LLLDCEVDQLSVVLARLIGFAVEVHGKTLPVSYAVGWKAYEPGDGLEKLIENADQNLYSHKASAKAPKKPIPVPV
jgi:hypothetical protein